MITQIFSGLKLYKEGTYTIETVARVFPQLFANCLNFITIRINKQHNMSPHFMAADLMIFSNRLGEAISKHEYDTLDDILLNFFNTTKVFIPGYGLSTMSFEEKYASIFQDKCNSFKGKHWNDIVDDFVEACLELFTKGTIV